MRARPISAFKNTITQATSFVPKVAMGLDH